MFCLHKLRLAFGGTECRSAICKYAQLMTKDALSCIYFRTSEELIETLEENQVQLQNMMTSKYIAYFLEEISSWQKRLSMVWNSFS